MNRRDALKVIAAAGVTTAAACAKSAAPNSETQMSDAVIDVQQLGMPWRTPDPFLFCVHHDDHYPAGNDQFGPAASLAGRDMGQDFAGKDGWRMYHGEVVPGFPQHPHRGFETVTIVRRGLLDHSDSLGAAARFGGGDVQWLTAGSGILHSEMFPLLNRDKDNPLELFQIWLNLPRVNKMAEPHFSMLWNETIPHHVAKDENGRQTELAIVAGNYGDVSAPKSPPKSYASQADSDVAMWTLKLQPGAKFTLPAAKKGSNRFLYFFRGPTIKVSGRDIPASRSIELRADVPTLLENGPEESELLMLQGRPIGEPVVQYGPFVMNSRAEIQQAFMDYQRTHFGGWPWDRTDPVHGRTEGRFARHADGRIEKPA